jgi:mono/diheme cytochrome c family protein
MSARRINRNRAPPIIMESKGPDMKIKVPLIAALIAILIAAQTSRSVWDGVYTQAQAERGKTLYTAQCAQCHGAELMGGDETPPLTRGFLKNFAGLTMNDLFERSQVTMPADNPGHLSRQQNADILSYIFAFNKLPAGNTELPTQGELLKQIRIDASKP